MVFAALSFAVAGTWARAALTVGLVISALAMLVAPVEPLRTAGTDCRRGRHRTRGYTPGRTPTCGNGGTTTESGTRGCPLAGRLAELRAQPRGLRGLGLKAVGIRCPRMSVRYAAEKRNLAESIAELREIANGHDDILAEAAGITPGSWYASPVTCVGHEFDRCRHVDLGRRRCG